MNNTILTTLLFALLSLSCAKASDSGISHNTKYTTTKSSIKTAKTLRKTINQKDIQKHMKGAYQTTNKDSTLQ